MRTLLALIFLAFAAVCASVPTFCDARTHDEMLSNPDARRSGVLEGAKPRLRRCSAFAEGSAPLKKSAALFAMALSVCFVSSAPPSYAQPVQQAKCDMDQLQQVIKKGFTALSKRDWSMVLPVGATLRFSAEICKEQRQILTGYVYGDYFLAEGFLGSNDRKNAKKYSDDGLAAVKSAEHYGKYPELTTKMESRFAILQRAIGI